MTQAYVNSITELDLAISDNALPPKGPLRRPNQLMSSTYALNQSNTKRIQVGLDLESGEDDMPIDDVMQELYNNTGISVNLKKQLRFKMTLKLINSGCKDGNWRELVLVPKNWIDLKNEFNRIKTYFLDEIAFYELYEGARAVRCDNFELYFGTSYGVKSIVMRMLPVSMKRTVEEAKKNKTKVYLPAVTMQMTTFDGIENVCDSIDERLKLLERDLESVNRTFKILYDQLRVKIEGMEPSEAKRLVVSDMIFKKFVKSNFEEIKKNVISQETNKCFVESFLDISLNEILSFYYVTLAKMLYAEVFEKKLIVV